MTADIEYAPQAVDWTKYITEIEDQSNCGSCWAFSATATLETTNNLKGSNLVSMSKQALVDCDDNSLGCDGGFMDDAI